MRIDNEQQFVLDAFNDSFGRKREKKIVLYGIGKNTNAILKNTKGFKFIGLMDPNAIGQTVYGLPVLSLDQVVDLDDGNLIIVIIARDSVTNIIYKRIAVVCKDYRIPVFDYKGRDMESHGNVYIPSDNPYWNESLEKLFQSIDEHDVISFDIFDTLLMRKVLYPTDVFDLTEIQLKKRGIDIAFSQLRQKAESDISKTYPNLDEIYSEIKRRLSGIEEDIEEILSKARAIEEETDSRTLTVRIDILRAFNYAISKGKQVYILSDMYYSSSFLDSLLNNKGISGYKGILVSNEIHCTKEDGKAYEVLLKEASGNDNRVLHVGDNRRADIESAKQYGIDTFHVYSGYELLQASSLQYMLVDTSRLEDRCIIGLLTEKMFNSPFAINEYKGQIHVNDLETMGYLFFGPILLEFSKWMKKLIQRNKVEVLLLPSRDGFLIEQIYSLIDSNVKRIYFRASRRAVTVAAIRDIDDIERVASRGFNGTVGEFLLKRFGVSINKDDSRKNIVLSSENEEIKKSIIKDYKTKILERAEQERENYLSYLNNKGINKETIKKNIVLFDFVTSGTVLYNMSLLFNEELLGVCFATMNLPNKMFSDNDSRIEAAYGNIRSYGNTTALADNYLVLESVLTDERESLVCIDGGKEVFEGNGWNSEFEKIKIVHKGIKQYAQDYLSIYGNIIDILDDSIKSADSIMGLFMGENVSVGDDLKELFKNDDAYDGIKAYQVWK